MGWNLTLERLRKRDKFVLREFDNGDRDNLRLLTKYELVVVGVRSLALLARIAVLRRENVMTLVTAFDGLSHQGVLTFAVLGHGVHVSGDCQTDEHGRVLLSAIVWERILGTAGEVDSTAVVTLIERRQSAEPGVEDFPGDSRIGTVDHRHNGNQLVNRVPRRTLSQVSKLVHRPLPQVELGIFSPVFLLEQVRVFLEPPS